MAIAEDESRRGGQRFTDEVANQPPPLVDYDLFATDRALGEAVRREGADWATPSLAAFGRRVGTAEVAAWGTQANVNAPVLRTHDRFGHRRDEVEFHPAWHALMKLSIEAGIHSGPWTEPRPGAHVARAALVYLAAENECGHLCPLAMTYAAVPTLVRQPEVAAEWVPRLLGRSYDARFLSDEEKRSARIVLFGHSWGASAAVALARDLQREGIPVLLTVQVDSIAKIGQNDALIPANVAQAVNFYQTHGFFHGRAKITAADSSRTQILGDVRLEYGKEPAQCRNYPWYDRLLFKDHTQIECDARLWSQVEELIRGKLPAVAEPVFTEYAQ